MAFSPELWQLVTLEWFHKGIERHFLDSKKTITSKLEVTIPEVQDIHSEKALRTSVECVINHFFFCSQRQVNSSASSLDMVLWWTWPMESSTQIVSGWQILNNWKEGLLMENIRNSYAWLPSPSKLFTFPN